MDRQEIGYKDRAEKERHRRLRLEAEVTIRSKSGLIPGRTLEVSESGMSAILPVNLQVGEIVELEIKLPMAPTTAHAVVRRRNVFRHEFEFVQPLRDLVGYEATPDDQWQEL